ncbi:MAG: methylmalonyl Co-A mutase-associated GTPase MeaB [Bacteroidota bacterium]
MDSIKKLLKNLYEGDKKALSRCISIVENDIEGYEKILTGLNLQRKIPVVGITGPPGGGKSTLINALIKQLLTKNKNVGIITIDPSSPFNYGSLLGDRLRMTEHFNNENVFIRSLASRGSLGGLSAKTIEVVDVMKAFGMPRKEEQPYWGFDYIFVETVGVGQSEVEIAGLADTTILVMVPESGDDIQTIKAGIMEIADIFVVNKADRAGADTFASNLNQLLHTRKSGLHDPASWTIPVIKAIATKGEGVEEIITSIGEHLEKTVNDKKQYLLAEKAYQLIQRHKMKNIDKLELQKEIAANMNKKNFNLYSFVKRWWGIG